MKVTVDVTYNEWATVRLGLAEAIARKRKGLEVLERELAWWQYKKRQAPPEGRGQCKDQIRSTRDAMETLRLDIYKSEQLEHRMRKAWYADE